VNNDIIYGWYNNLPIKFEIIKSLYKREMAVINRTKKDSKVTIRMLKCHNVKNFEFLQDYVINAHSCNQLFNYYYSLAKYKNGIPNQDWRLNERNKSEMGDDSRQELSNKEWTKIHFNQMESYDFLLDIDGNFEEMEYAYDSAKDIKTFFDIKRIPYELRFSGCGFHFIIPYMYMPQLSLNPFIKEENIYKLYSRIAKFFFDDFSDLIDKHIYDSRRICKIPYTLSCYPEQDSAYLCFPFHSDSQFKMFNIKFMEYMNINPKIMQYRGTHLFNSDSSVKFMDNIKEVI
jgi:hypothetical protein